MFRRSLRRRRRRCHVFDRRIASGSGFLLPRVDRWRRQVPVKVFDHPLHGRLVVAPVRVDVVVLVVAL